MNRKRNRSCLILPKKNEKFSKKSLRFWRVTLKGLEIGAVIPGLDRSIESLPTELSDLPPEQHGEKFETADILNDSGYAGTVRSSKGNTNWFEPKDPNASFVLKKKKKWERGKDGREKLKDCDRRKGRRRHQEGGLLRWLGASLWGNNLVSPTRSTLWTLDGANRRLGALQTDQTALEINGPQLYATSFGFTR
jgi:hypothetical protein